RQVFAQHRTTIERVQKDVALNPHQAHASLCDTIGSTRAPAQDSDLSEDLARSQDSYHGPFTVAVDGAHADVASAAHNRIHGIRGVTFCEDPTTVAWFDDATPCLQSIELGGGHSFEYGDGEQRRRHIEHPATMVHSETDR